MASLRLVALTSGMYALIDNTHNVNSPIPFSCNWLGGNATVHAMDWYGKKKFAALQPKVMKINDQAIGEVTNLDNFSWA